MTIKLIRIGEIDTNDYEEDLNMFGYENLEKSLKEDAISVWNFFCNEELVLQGLKKFVTQFYQFNQPEKKHYANFLMTGEAKIILIKAPSLIATYLLKPAPIFIIPTTPLCCMAN